MTYQTFIEEALSQAAAGVPPDKAFVLDEAWLAEDFVSVVFQRVGVECAKDEHKRSLLRKSKVIAFTNGSGSVTSDVLTEYKEDSTLYDTSSLTKKYSLVRERYDFIQPRTGHALWLGTYCIDGTTIDVVEPNANYTVGSGITANRTLVIPCAPTIPASAATAIDVPDEVIDDLIVGLAEALQGANARRYDARTS